MWKANNPNAKVEGFTAIDNELQQKIDKVPKDKFYRINEDRIFLNEAIKNIKENPKRYLILYLEKVISFLFIDIDSSENNYYNPLHYMPVLLLGITSLFGIFLSSKKSYNFNYLILIFFLYIMIFSIFALLSRYKLSIIPLQIIFTGILLNYIQNKFFKTK